LTIWNGGLVRGPEGEKKANGRGGKSTNLQILRRIRRKKGGAKRNVCQEGVQEKVRRGIHEGSLRRGENYFGRKISVVWWTAKVKWNGTGRRRKRWGGKGGLVLKGKYSLTHGLKKGPDKHLSSTHHVVGPTSRRGMEGTIAISASKGGAC